jgi:hypothetical protein
VKHVATVDEQTRKLALGTSYYTHVTQLCGTNKIANSLLHFDGVVMMMWELLLQSPAMATENF